MAIVVRPSDAPDTEVVPPAAPSAGGNHRPAHRRPTRRLRRVRRVRPLVWLAVVAVLAAGTLVGVEAASGSPTYPLRAVFSNAPGLFPGASVEVLGVPVGVVSSVQTVGDSVVVGMAVQRGRPVPARATASLAAPQLLGEPDVELAPGYTGGPTLAAGSTIPLSRTSVPVSASQLLGSLQHTLKAITPHAVGNLVTYLAQDFAGQGKGLNRLIAGAAGTLQLLAEKGDDLGQLNGSLAQLTGSLDSQTSQITQLITDYDTVSGVVASHSSQLGDAVTQLSQASTALVKLLTPNLGPLETDVGTVTTAGRTVDRNLTSIDQILSSATSLFAAAGRAYTPGRQWLSLNLQTPPGATGAYVAGIVRDRLAGVCRRIAAHHSAGLSTSQLQTLAQCGNPSSGFFNPVVDQFATILNDLSSGTAPSGGASPASMLQQGLAEIPGVSSSAAPAASTNTPSATPATAPTTTPSTTTPSGSSSPTCLGGLLGSMVTCSSSSSSASTANKTAKTSTGSSGSGSSGSSGGLGGLLAYRTPAAAPSGTGASLTASSAHLLPPLPASAPGGSARARHRAPRTHAKEVRR